VKPWDLIPGLLAFSGRCTTGSPDGLSGWGVRPMGAAAGAGPTAFGARAVGYSTPAWAWRRSSA
jgi:hypothetical protein